MTWEQFIRPQSAPTVTINRGWLVPSAVASQLIGRPRYVDLHVDRAARLIGIKAAADDSLNAYSLDPRSNYLAAGRLLRDLGVDLDARGRVDARLEDDMLVVDLAEVVWR